MGTQKLRRYAYLTVSVVGAAIAAYVLVRYLLFLLLPFLLAWSLALLVRPAADALARRTRLSARIWRVVLCLALTLGSLLAVGGFLGFLIAEAWRFVVGVGEGEGLRALLALRDGSTGGALVPPDWEPQVREALGAMISHAVSALARWIARLAESVPKVFLFTVVTVISGVYFSWDLETIHAFSRRVLPTKVYTMLVNCREGAFSTVLRYVRSYLLLMAITFAWMAIGLTFLRVEYAVVLALVIAILDALPVIGVGTVLIPWSVFECVRGNFPLGIGLIALYAINEVMRQFLEPKIVGRTLGIHPLITLVLLYVSYSLLGLLGLLLLPVLSVIVNVLLLRRRTAVTGASATIERDQAE